MKLVTIGYVPPQRMGLCADAFCTNLVFYKNTHPIVLFSDAPYPGKICGDSKKWLDEWVSIDNPESRLPRHWRTTNKFALSNLLFMTACRMARLRYNASHIIYLESDCRVGVNHWDDIMAREFFTHPRFHLIGGSAICYNPFNAGIQVARRWEQFVAANTRRNFPIPTYGCKNQDQQGDGLTLVAVNGALGIYDLDWLWDAFHGFQNTVQTAMEMHAWDFVVGGKMWEQFGIRSFDLVQNLSCIYSSYGNVLTSETERLGMLRSGQVVAVHQVKSDAIK